MKKVSLYPFNKITQGLIRFKDLLDFEIQSVIDFSLCIGEDAGKIVQGKTSSIIITDSVEEGLKDVDTLILNDPGTAFAGNAKLFEEHNLVEKWRELVIKANEMGIEVISVHEIFDQNTKTWMKQNDVAITIGSKMDKQILDRLDVLDVEENEPHHEIYSYLKTFEVDRKLLWPKKNIKKILIMSTRGCLGKFTTKMSLLRELKSDGKKSVALITEPTAFLFGQYDADIPKFLALKSFTKYPYYINELVKKAERDGNEYILLSGQGSIAPSRYIRMDALKMWMAQAFNPDIVLLVTGYGEDQNVQDCIDILRLYTAKSPVALLIPDKVEVKYGKYDIKTPEQIEERKKELKNKFGIPHVELIKDIAAIKDLVLKSQTMQ